MISIADSLPFVYTDGVEKALFWIAFCPIFWTVISQLELRTRLLTRLFGGDRYTACRAFAMCVFLNGLYRDHVFNKALDTQPVSPLLSHSVVIALGGAVLAAGSLFVVSSMWALGVTGTYSGDYFGILLKERITSFPFNVVDNPMYFGSYLSFMGTALYRGRFMGVLLSSFVWVIYYLTLRFEAPYTAYIYSKRGAKDAGKEAAARPLYAFREKTA